MGRRARLPPSMSRKSNKKSQKNRAAPDAPAAPARPPEAPARPPEPEAPSVSIFAPRESPRPSAYVSIPSMLVDGPIIEFIDEGPRTQPPSPPERPRMSMLPTPAAGVDPTRALDDLF